MRYTKKMVEEEISHYMTPKGVKMWWDKTRPWPLNGLTPREAWEKGMKEEVYNAARGGRDMTAT